MKQQLQDLADGLIKSLNQAKGLSSQTEDELTSIGTSEGEANSAQ